MTLAMTRSRPAPPPRVFVCENDGDRLDRFLADRLKDFSRAYVQNLITQGCVTVDGLKQSRDYRLHERQSVSVETPRPQWDKSEFERWVIFEDAALIALNKPAGLLVHPLGPSWLKDPEAAMTETEPNLAGVLAKARPGIFRSGVERCGIVHRLDRATSGVMIVAKTQEAQRRILNAFKERLVSKVYWAIVLGRPHDSERVSAPIGRSGPHRTVSVTAFGKNAETSVKVLRKAKTYSWVEARPLTGRTHQIRAHLAWLGHPVAGDYDFDKGAASGALHPPRMMLHARRISFVHPSSGRPAAFEVDAPADFKAFWKRASK